MVAADRLLRYIASTSDLGLTFCSHNDPSSLFAYVDSSYDCYSYSKSHSGISLHLGRHSGVFFFLSKKQTITADSVTVAEYVATHSACQKILWTQNIHFFYSNYSFPR